MTTTDNEEFYFTMHIGVSAKTRDEALLLLEAFLDQTHDKDGRPNPIYSAQQED